MWFLGISGHFGPQRRLPPSAKSWTGAVWAGGQLVLKETSLSYKKKLAPAPLEILEIPVFF